MKKILLVLVALGMATSLCAHEVTVMSSDKQEEAMKILEKKREEILERDKIREKEMKEAKKLEEDLKAKNGEVTEENAMGAEQAMVADEGQMTAEEIKNLTPVEKLELTRKKAMNKLDFYERVVRSVEREENEVKAYEEIMKMD